MKKADKEKQAEFHKNDWNTAKKNWTALARKKPGQKEKIKNNRLVVEIKMLYGKESLSDKRKKKVNKFLGGLVDEGENFGQYWGY